MRDAAEAFVGYGVLEFAAFPADAILRRLSRDGYDGFVTLEPHIPKTAVQNVLERDAAFLKASLEKL
jgi:sugar phosphate isomerase/epimerase